MSKQNTVTTNFNMKSETFEIPKRLRKPHNPLVKEIFDGTFEATVEVPKTDYKRKSKYRDDYDSILEADYDPELNRHVTDPLKFDGADEETIALYLNKK